MSFDGFHLLRFTSLEIKAGIKKKHHDNFCSSVYFCVSFQINKSDWKSLFLYDQALNSLAWKGKHWVFGWLQTWTSEWAAKFQDWSRLSFCHCLSSFQNKSVRNDAASAGGVSLYLSCFLSQYLQELHHSPCISFQITRWKGNIPASWRNYCNQLQFINLVQHLISRDSDHIKTPHYPVYIYTILKWCGPAINKVLT